MTTISLVLFVLDSLRLGLPLVAVERVVPAAQVTPLPGSPDRVKGAFNLEGRIVPVLDLRSSFRLSARGPRPEDHFLVVRSNGRLIALLVDEAQGVVDFETTAVMPIGEIVEGVESIQGVVRLEDGLLLINDPDRFLHLREERMLERALREAARGEG